MRKPVEVLTAAVTMVTVLTSGMCSTVTADGPAPLAQSVQWPGVRTVWQHGTMYFASAPNAEGLAHAKEQGVTTVINLMTSSENPLLMSSTGEKHWFAYALEYYFPQLKRWNEAQTAKELGLRYEQIPLDVDHPDPAAVQRFMTIVQEVQAKQLLVHCDAAGRALTMWAIYLGTAGGLTPQQALAQAESAGLTHEGLKQFVLSYLEQAQKAS